MNDDDDDDVQVKNLSFVNHHVMMTNFILWNIGRRKIIFWERLGWEDEDDDDDDVAMEERKVHNQVRGDEKSIDDDDTFSLIDFLPMHFWLNMISSQVQFNTLKLS